MNNNNNSGVSLSNIDSMSEAIKRINNGLLKDVELLPEKDINMVPSESPMFINTEENSIKGIQEHSGLSESYFSQENIATIQGTIRFEVHQRTSKIIDRQSESELNIVMRSIYLQNGNPVISSDKIVDEVQRLNEMVVDFCVDQITTQVRQHEGYIKKISSLPVPIDRPEYLNKENYTYDISNLMD